MREEPTHRERRVDLRGPACCPECHELLEVYFTVPKIAGAVPKVCVYCRGCSIGLPLLQVPVDQGWISYKPNGDWEERYGGLDQAA